MKKTLLSIATIALMSGVMVAQNFGLYPTNNASTAGRGPNTNNKSQINCSIYTMADFNNDLPVGATIVFMGWYPTVTPNPVTNANMKVYLENTSDAMYAKTSNTWTAITAPMTTCFTGTVNIPNVAGPYGTSLTTPFVYTGQNLYVAFEYVNTGAVTTTTNSPTYLAYTSGTVSIPQTKTGASTTSTITPISVNAAASAFKACIVVGYTVTGTDAGIRFVSFGSNIKTNSALAMPVNVNVKNYSSTSLAAGSYNVLFNDGVSTQTLAGTPMSANSTSVVSGTINHPLTAGLTNYSVTVVATGDANATNNMMGAKKFIFDATSVLYEDYNDTAKWKNVVNTNTLNVAAMPANWSVINNDGGGTVGPYLIGSATNNPYFEGQSISDFFQTANGTKIDDWLITPQVTGFCGANKDSLVFYIKGTDPVSVDSVEILLSSNGGNAVTDFTTSIAYIEVPAAAWTRFAYNLNAVIPTGTSNYRIAFRYKMGNGGSTGTYSNYFSLDCSHIKRANAVITSNAGTNQTTASTMVNLTGSSTGTITSSTWSQISGPAATITTNTAMSTPVTLTGGTGNYCFQLSVTDGCNIATSTVCVNATIATGITTSDIELISVNPNPAKDVVYLNAGSIRGTEIAISITSVDGRVVYSSNTVAEEKMLINLQNLNAGIYFINVNGKEFKQMTKLIKE